MCLVTSNSIPPIHLLFLFSFLLYILVLTSSSSLVVMGWNWKKESVVKHTYQHHLVWYFKPSRREAGLRSLRDREGTKLAIDFLFFLVVPSLDRWVRKCQLKSSLWAGRAVALLIFLLVCVCVCCGGVSRKKGAVVQHHPSTVCCWQLTHAR